MSILSWIYVILAFFEPLNHTYLETKDSNIALFLTVEISIVLFLFLDSLMEFMHKRLHNKELKASILSNNKMIFKILISLMLIADIIYSYSDTTSNSRVRFARPLRPCNNFIICK